MLFVFLITLQEEILLITLQFYNINFANALNTLGFVAAILASTHVIAMIVSIYKKLFSIQMDNSARVLFNKFENGNLVPSARMKYMLMFYIATKIIFTITFVVGNSETILGVLAALLALMFFNDFLQFSEQYSENRAQPKHHLVLNILVNTLVIPLYVCVVAVEGSKNLSSLTDGQMSWQGFVEIFLYIFLVLKFLITIADVSMNFKAK